MALRITPLIGKKNLHGSWIIEPPPPLAIHDKLMEAQQSNLQVRVQIRPSVTAPGTELSAEVATICRDRLQEIRTKGTCTVLLDRGRLDRTSRRHISPQIQTYEAGRVYEVSAPTAFRLLNADPYRYLFEEVDSAAPALTSPAPQSESEAVRELREQNKALADALAAINAKLDAKGTTKKRTLKDTLSAADAADEGEG